MRISRRFPTALIAVAVLWAGGCSRTSPAETATSAPQTADTPASITSETGAAAPTSYFAVTERPAQEPSPEYHTMLIAKSRVNVISRVPGMVVTVYAEVGMDRRWKKDEILAYLDDKLYDLAYQKAEAEAERARAIYERHKRARENYLGEFEVEIVSELEVEQAKAEYKKAQVDSALREMDLDHTKIRAPISGYITERRIQAGQWIGEQEELFTIVDLDTLWAVVIVEYSVLRSLGPIETVTLRVNPGGDPITVEGQLLLKDPILIPPTGGVSGVKITIQVINEDTRLLPGMPARVVFTNTPSGQQPPK